MSNYLDLFNGSHRINRRTDVDKKLGDWVGEDVSDI